VVGAHWGHAACPCALCSTCLLEGRTPTPTAAIGQLTTAHLDRRRSRRRARDRTSARQERGLKGHRGG
jgi:hypothetical protein